MAVLVTGGAGFVGLNLIERLLEQGRETVAFDRRPPPIPTQTRTFTSRSCERCFRRQSSAA